MARVPHTRVHPAQAVQQRWPSAVCLTTGYVYTRTLRSRRVHASFAPKLYSGMGLQRLHVDRPPQSGGFPDVGGFRVSGRNCRSPCNCRGRTGICAYVARVRGSERHRAWCVPSLRGGLRVGVCCDKSTVSGAVDACIRRALAPVYALANPQSAALASALEAVSPSQSLRGLIAVSWPGRLHCL